MDLVGDPAPDFIGRQYDGGAELWVIENVECATAWTSTMLGAMGFTNAVGGDFDGDGNQDLAVANLGDDDVSVLLNNGDGTFTQTLHYRLGVK